MPITKPAKQTDYYRKINFIGARILQASELNRTQAFDETRAAGTLTPFYRDGATINVGLTVNPTSVVLSPIDPTQPMRVFVNGVFEPIPATGGNIIINFTPKTSGTEAVYLSWVMWRVTLDGEGNSIADPELKDPSGEEIGEAGQLQIIVDGVSYHTEPLDGSAMMAKSTSAIEMFKFSWQPDATLVQVQSPNARETGWADENFFGLVALSAPGAEGVACATTDSRLTDTRTPRDLSITTSKVASPAPTVSGAYGQEYNLSETAGGILSYKIIYEGFKTSLKTAMDYLVSRVTSLLNTSNNHELRISALENQAPPTIDLGYHVGQPIGVANSHPALVKVRDSHPLTVQCAVNWNSLAPAAISVIGPESQQKASITQQGDFVIHNSAILTDIGNELGSYANFAKNYKMFRDAVTQALTSGGGSATIPTSLSGDVEGSLSSCSVVRLRGKTVPTPGAGDNGKILGFDGSNWSLISPPAGEGGATTLSGDVEGPVTGTTVKKLQGRSVSATAPSNGQALVWNGTSWAPGAVSGGSSASASESGGYVVVNLGSVKMAFGTFTMQDGDSITPPSGFSWSWHKVAPSIKVLGDPSLPLQVEYNESAHRIEIYTWSNGQTRREGRAGAYATVSVTFINLT